MRYVSLAAVAVLAAVIPSAAFGQYSIANYQYVSEEKVTRTTSRVTYHADLVNSGPAQGSVTATYTSAASNVQVVAGQDKLNFAPVPANGQVTSSNTFTILVDRTVTFDWSQIHWTFQAMSLAPIANPGPNKGGQVNQVVNLDGSASTNPSQVGTLTYSWAFVLRPAVSSATISNPTAVMPSFVPDVAGNYVIALTVSNGQASNTANVTISVGTPPTPTANAGPDQGNLHVGDTVTLNGSKSTSSASGTLTYAWTFTQRPPGSTAALNGANTVSPTFVVDQLGPYKVQLIVTENGIPSAPSFVTITTGVVAPVANPGPDQSVKVNSLVQLDGSGSTDANKLPLTYLWSFQSKPDCSTAQLSSTTAVKPTFTPNCPGTYVVQLTVNNGQLSNSKTVTITTQDILAPMITPLTNQNVNGGATVQLNVSATDPQNLPLTYQWAFTSKPAGSAASLSSAVITNPTFVADLAGNYVLQVTVSNGFKSSTANVTISTTCAQPTAVPGQPQTVLVGATVNLDGSASGDPCHDPLTYAFTFNSKPAGSNATLANATTAKPSFVADVAGDYVVQLIVNNGITPSNPATVTITATAQNKPTITLTPNPLNVATGGSGTLTITLSSNTTGATVNLSSDNSGVATVPASVNLASGVTSTTVQVSGVSVGSANITGSAGNSFANGTAKVNVANIMIGAPASTIVPLGQTAAFNITLSQAAPTDVTISLTSSDPAKVTVPASVTILAGKTAPDTQPLVTGAGIGSATVTATANGYTSGSGAVTTSAPTMAFTGSPLALTVGANGTLKLNLTNGQAPAGGLTVNLSSSDTSKATVPATVKFAAGATSADVQVTGVAAGSATITASASGIADATATVNVASLVITVGNTTVALGQSGALNISLSQAPVADVTVTLASSDTSKVTVPASVVIKAGKTSPDTAPQATGVGVGSATITASATNFTSGSGTVTVSAPTMSFTNSPLPLSPGASGNLTLTLTGGQAPAGGLTVTLNSSNTGVATVPATVNFVAGATTVNVPVTAVGGGTTTITASAPGIANATGTVNVSQPSISISSGNVTLGGTASVTVSLPANAAAPVTVNLVSSDPSKVGVVASVTIAAGSSSTSAQVTGAGIGSANIAGSATGYTSGSGAVTVPAPTMSLTPNPLAVAPAGTGTLTVTLSGGKAPAGGLTVSLNSSNTAAATVPASVIIPAGTTSTTITVSGTPAGGSSTITASASGISNAIATVNVTGPPPTITVPNVSVGKDLQTSISISINMPAPAGGLNVSLTSSDANKVLIAGRQTDTGLQQLNGIVIPEGSTTVGGIYIQGLVDSGTATITASAPNFNNGVGTVTLTPSGFQIAAPGGGSNFTTQVGASPTTLTINSVRLDSALSFAGIQQIRGGLSVTVNLNNSTPSVGSVGTPVTFPKVDPSSPPGGVDTATTTFTPSSNTGSTVISIAPGTFSMPNTGTSVTATVATAGIVCTGATVGQNLETNSSCSFQGGAPAAGQTVTITSNDTQKFLLSKNTTDAGSSSIMLTTKAGLQGGVVIPGFFVYGVGNSGSATYTAMYSLSGVSSGTGTVNLSPSGIVIAGPGGIGQSSFLVSSNNTTITLYAARLSSTGAFIEQQPIAGGKTAMVTVSSSNSSVGTVAPANVTIPSAATSSTTQFTKGSGNGSTDLTVSTASGFSTPSAQFTKVTATVNPPGANLSCNGLTVGQNLEIPCTVSVQAGPAYSFTITSSNASQVLLAPNATAAGANSIPVTISAGSTSATFYVQGLTSSGSATITATAASLTDTLATINLAPSGVVISGMFGPFIVAPLSGGPVPINVDTAVLNPDNSFQDFQLLRGGISPLSIVLNSSDTTVGTIQSPVVIQPGTGHVDAQFTPVAAGGTSITVVPPSGFTTPSNKQNVSASVF